MNVLVNFLASFGHFHASSGPGHNQHCSLQRWDVMQYLGTMVPPVPHLLPKQLASQTAPADTITPAPIRSARWVHGRPPALHAQVVMHCGLPGATIALHVNRHTVMGWDDCCHVAVMLLSCCRHFAVMSLHCMWTATL